MPIPDLLLGTRRLRREIQAQAQRLDSDIERVKFTTTQLRQTLIARATSPLGLASAVAAGFTVGKLSTRPANPKRIDRRAIAGLAAAILTTARSIGLQAFLPIAADWVKSKLAEPSEIPSQQRS